MNISIKKASIKSGMFLSYSYDLTEKDVTNNINTSSDAPVHDDLKIAFRNLIPLFCHICEEISNDELVKDALVNPEIHLQVDEDNEEGKYPFLKYNVTGFTIGGKDENEGVTITGYKLLDSGGIVNFNTPFRKFESDYVFASYLSSGIEVAKKEVFAYMQGKQAPRQEQFGLFDGDEIEVTEDDVFNGVE